MPDLSLMPTVGLVPGLTIQFAVGSPDAVGAGVALSEDAFDAIEPHLRRVWPEWNSMGRYGVTELPRSIAAALVQELRGEASYVGSASQEAVSKAELFNRLADWLDDHGGQEPISILGI